MARTRNRKKSTVINIDLSEVEGRIDIEDGEHPVKVKEVTKEDGPKAEYLKWVFEVTEGDAEGATLYFNTSLADNSLWNLRGLLEALGQDIPEEAYDLDLEELVDLECVAIVEKETYEGKRRPKMVDYAPAEDSGSKKKSGRGKDKDDDEPKSSRGGKDKKPAKLPKLTQDEVNEMDQDELEEVNKEYDLDVDLDELKTLRKMKPAIIDALDNAGHLKD